MDDIQLKNNVREYRAKFGLNQEDLARKVGTTRQTIIAIEKGTYNPTAKLALLICLALDAKFEELFYF